MSNTTNANVENTLWENQSEEYKSSILSKLKFEYNEEYRQEVEKKALEAEKNSKMYIPLFIPTVKIISSDNIEESTLILPDNVEEIGENAFTNQNFEKVVLPKNLRFIERNAFRDCKNLKEVVFNDKLISIDDEAFANCPLLKMVEFGNSISIIGQKCFNACKSLEQVIFNGTEENPLIEIDEDAFSYCESLKRVVLPKSLKKIEKGVFSHCSSLSEINFPEFLGYIGWCAFWGCKALKEIDLSNHYIFIDYQAFALCGIENFILPKNINTINGMALYKTQIKELTIPESVRLLEKDCLTIDTLEKVYIKDNEYLNKILSQKDNAGIPKDCEIIKY